MNFDSMKLDDALLRTVHSLGYTTPTPIQQQAIPVILSGRDILARAQTGTGKTAAFTLPLLQTLSGRPARGGKRVRALVLAPTRELAMQVCDSVRAYGRRLPLRSSVIFGGVKIGPQIEHLRRGADIVVATPGRLLDHVSQRTIDLSGVEMLVLDEADRMLDMGFIHDIRRVIGLLPRDRQTLLFSATLSAEIRKLAATMQRDPVHIDVKPETTTAEGVSQLAYAVPADTKRPVLSKLIRDGAWRQVLVFTRTKHRANRVARHLEDDGITSTAIHGNKSQSARTRALADFKAGRVRVLVATDIAARGLDIEQLPHVVNFELPNVPEDYVHRIGRTGRAGMTGEAVSLVAPDEQGYLRDIERLLGSKVPRAEAPVVERDASRPVKAERAEPARNERRRDDTRRPARPRAAESREDRGFEGRGNAKPGQSRRGRPAEPGSRHTTRSNHRAGGKPAGKPGRARRRSAV